MILTGLLAGLLVCMGTASAQVRLPELPKTVVPTAKTVEKAKASYAEVVKFYQQNQLKEALAAARKTFNILPNTSSALILSTVHAELGQACIAFDFGLVALDLDPTPAEEKAVTQNLVSYGKACASGLGWIHLKVEPRHAEVQIDKRSVPNRRRVGVTPGAYPVRVKAPGYRTQNTIVSIQAGIGFRLKLALEKIPEKVVKPVAVVAAPPTAQPRETVRVSKGKNRTIQWSLIGTGGAALLAQGLLLTSANSAADRAQALSQPSLEPSATRQAKYDDEKSSAEALERTGWVVGGIGLVAIAAGVVWMLTDTPTETQHGWIRPAPDGRGATVGIGGEF